jgi:hypothetical protein
VRETGEDWLKDTTFCYVSMVFASMSIQAMCKYYDRERTNAPRNRQALRNHEWKPAQYLRDILKAQDIMQAESQAT